MDTPIFPPLYFYAQKTMDEDPLLHSQASWLRGEYVTVVHIWLPYIGADRYLAGGVPERALGSYE